MPRDSKDSRRTWIINIAGKESRPGRKEVAAGSAGITSWPSPRRDGVARVPEQPASTSLPRHFCDIVLAFKKDSAHQMVSQLVVVRTKTAKSQYIYASFPTFSDSTVSRMGFMEP